jgi:hypothetical protein
MTVQGFIELKLVRSKDHLDLEGEDWCDVWDFQEKLRKLCGEREEE